MELDKEKKHADGTFTTDFLKSGHRVSSSLISP